MLAMGTGNKPTSQPHVGSLRR